MICVDLQDPLVEPFPPIRRWLGPAETAIFSLMQKPTPVPAPSSSAKAVCARIRQEREARNWTQDYLGHAVGVTEQTISRYERDRPPRLSMLSKIAAVMGLSVHDLMPEERTRDPGLAELTTWWQSASRSERRLLLQSARNLAEARDDADNDAATAARR